MPEQAGSATAPNQQFGAKSTGVDTVQWRLVMGGLGGGSCLLTPGQTKGAASQVFRQPHLQHQEQPLGQLCIDVSPLSIVIAPVHLQESIDLFQYLHTMPGQGL